MPTPVPRTPSPRPPAYGLMGLMLVAAGLIAASLRPPDPGPTRISCLPVEGPAGIKVVLEGEGLEATRAVRFGDREAPFKVVSDRRVETRVPEGAASAPILLVTGGGASYSTGAPFQVVQ